MGAGTHIADIALFGPASCTPSAATGIQRMIAAIQSRHYWTMKEPTKQRSGGFSVILAETSQSASTPTKDFGNFGAASNS